MYVPDTISIGGTVFGLVTFSLRPDVGIVDALLGAAVGFGVVWLPFGVLYRSVRGRTGMGLGDAKLLMMAGAWFGWMGAAFALMAGAVQGTIAALAVLLLRGKIEEPAGVVAEKRETEQALALLSPKNERQPKPSSPRIRCTKLLFGRGARRIAFGPFLALAMLEYLLVGRDWLQGYVRWLGLLG